MEQDFTKTIVSLIYFIQFLRSILETIHQFTFDSLKRVADKCCDHALCGLQFIKTKICCKTSECQQLCYGSGPAAHVNTYQVKYVLDMEIPEVIKAAAVKT